MAACYIYIGFGDLYGAYSSGWHPYPLGEYIPIPMYITLYYFKYGTVQDNRPTSIIMLINMPYVHFLQNAYICAMNHYFYVVKQFNHTVMVVHRCPYYAPDTISYHQI